jgi:hypothetical protein
LRAKALESVSDATLAVFSSVFGHFRFNRRGLCGVRGGNGAKERQPFMGRRLESRARLAAARGELNAAETEWLELELLHEELNG